MKRSRAATYRKTHQDDRQAWSERFDSCWLCGGKANWLALQTHEIYSRAQARNSWAFPANYFRVCQLCHQQTIPTLSMEAQLAYKLLRDAENFDIQPFREVAEKFTGRPTRLVDEGEILEAVRQLIIQRKLTP